MSKHEPTLINVSLRLRHRVPFFFLMGLLLAVASAMGAAWIGSDDRPVGLLIGAAVFVGLTGLLVWIMAVALRPRTLTVDTAGIHMADTGPRPFSVGWAELSCARVSYASKIGPLRFRLFPRDWAGDAPPGEAPRRQLGISRLTRLDLVPADASFLDRHPNMARWQQLAVSDNPPLHPPDWPRTPTWASVAADRQPVLRIAFGSLPEVIPEIDEALRIHGGDRHQPPVNEGIAWGFRYS